MGNEDTVRSKKGNDVFLVKMMVAGYTILFFWVKMVTG
jgi:valyl-tRNA synthetase